METRPAVTWTLRPLGLGEMLDRAITLTVRNFPVLALIALVYALPQAVFSFYGTQDQAQIFGGLVDVLKAASAGKHVDMDALVKAQSGAAVFNGWTVLLYAWVVIALPLYSMALLYAASCGYRGLAVDATASYRATLRHWASLIGITLVYFVVVMLALMTVLVAGVCMILALTFAGTILRNSGVAAVAIILGGVVTVLMSIALLIASMMAYLALHFAWMANVLEGRPLVAAITTSFGRIFGRASWRRSIVVACAYGVIATGYAFVVFAGVGLIAALSRSGVAGIAFATVMEVGITAFFAAFFLVFYYDVRVRREGLDLELAAAAIPLPAPALT